MSITIQFTITDAGVAAAWNANSTGIDLELTHVQFGTGNKVPDGSEVTLVTPQQAAAIGSGYQVSDTQIRMSAIFTGAAAYTIREIGIWAGDPGAGGTLFGYWSQASGDLAVKSAGIDLIFAHDMILDAAIPPGSVTVTVDTAQGILIANHEAAADPHPQYLTLADGNSTYSALGHTHAGLTQATETALGIAEIATQAETNAGTDDLRIVTPLKLRSGFAISLNQNGYIKFPAWLGGLLVQWGLATCPDESHIDVNFPTAYPTAVFVILATMKGSAEVASGVASAYTSTINLSTFRLVHDKLTNSDSTQVYWLSVGH